MRAIGLAVPPSGIDISPSSNAQPAPASGPRDPDSAPAPTNTLLGRLLALADRPAGVVVLVVLALLEATVFPGPTEAMLLALTLARPKRAWVFAAIATAASAVGGLLGYQLGATLFGEVARPLLETYGFTGQVDTVARVYRENMMLALVTSGYTPIPYMLYTMIAGASSLPVLPFVAGSLVGRALKYLPIAVLAYFFGPAVHRILRRFGGVAVLVIVLTLLLFLLLAR